jgi:hypothetical protein
MKRLQSGQFLWETLHFLIEDRLELGFDLDATMIPGSEQPAGAYDRGKGRS